MRMLRQADRALFCNLCMQTHTHEGYMLCILQQEHCGHAGAMQRSACKPRILQKLNGQLRSNAAVSSERKAHTASPLSIFSRTSNKS